LKFEAAVLLFFNTVGVLHKQVLPLMHEKRQ